MGLTDLQIKKLVPKKQRYEVLDGKGLYVRVMPSGSRSWIFRYLYDETPRRMTLGTYPGISLAQARELHGRAMMEIQRGNDPGKQAKEAKAKRKTAPTFQDLLDEFWEIELKAKASGKERRRLVEKDVLPAWRKKKVVALKRRDVVLLIDKVRERAPITANRLQGVLVRMFNFASERGIIDFSPLVGLRKTREEPRSRVLGDKEIRLLWKGLDLENKDIDVYRPTKLALKFILLTGQRPGEVTGMNWAELTEEGFWNIPAGRIKNSIEQRVPVCPMAADVIDQARPYSGNSPYVFRSPNDSEKPLTRHALSTAINRHWEEMGFPERFTPHDLRRTLRTRLAEIGISDVVAERVLSHKLQGIMAVYNRHSYDTEKRQALSLWEQRLKEILGLSEPTSNVIPFTGGRNG